MASTMRNSSLYVALSGKQSELNEKTKDRIKHAFESLFEDSAQKVSQTVDSTTVEIIYELKTPVVHDEHMTKEFYENLEVLLYELMDFNAHFTQFRRVDK